MSSTDTRLRALLSPVDTGLQAVRSELELLLGGESPALADMLEHLTRFQGKRLRAALVLLAGKAAGLATEQFISQERFLNGAFADLLRASPALGQAIDVRQLQTLTHPAHMGQSFRVLVQSW